MAVSSAPTFKNTLHDALALRAAMADVRVSYGMPLGDPPNDLLILDKVVGRQDSAALGAQKRGEEYALTVIIDCFRQGTDQQTVDERAFTLMADVENYLRDDATMGLVPTFALFEAQIGDFKLEPLASDVARGARLTFEIEVQARI